MIIVSVNNKTGVDDWLTSHQQYAYSGATAMQNMWLAAWGLGIGGCWVSLDESTTKHIVSLPDEHTLIGGLVLGHMEKLHTEKMQTVIKTEKHYHP